MSGPAIADRARGPWVVRGKDAAARGVWGHAPPGNFEFF